MVSVLEVESLFLKYPVLGADSRSVRGSFIKAATGGALTALSDCVYVTALEDISFKLETGDRLGLIGHNGAGKSSLLRALAGIYLPTSGIIKIEGEISTLLNLGVGMQHGATGYENIQIQCMIRGYNKTQQERVIKDVEAFTELGDFLSMPVKIYSSGMSVRLSFAIATALVPDIFLVDEVIGAGDAAFIIKAKKRVERLIETSNIMVLASHSDDLISKICNKAIWLDHGKIKYFGSAREAVALYNESNKEIRKNFERRVEENLL